MSRPSPHMRGLVIITSSNFNSLFFITPTPSHFLSSTLAFSVIINKLYRYIGPHDGTNSMDKAERLMYLSVSDSTSESPPGNVLGWEIHVA